MPFTLQERLEEWEAAKAPQFKYVSVRLPLSEYKALLVFREELAKRGLTSQPNYPLSKLMKRAMVYYRQHIANIRDGSPELRMEALALASKYRDGRAIKQRPR